MWSEYCLSKPVCKRTQRGETKRPFCLYVIAYLPGKSLDIFWYWIHPARHNQFGWNSIYCFRHIRLKKFKIQRFCRNEACCREVSVLQEPWCIVNLSDKHYQLLLFVEASMTSKHSPKPNWLRCIFSQKWESALLRLLTHLAFRFRSHLNHEQASFWLKNSHLPLFIWTISV